jgi:glycosyltransferase involved in cell wall biosynthesis
MRIAVSVVIPVYNDAVRLRTCLEALSAQTIEEPFEILVVDNGSSDDPAIVVDDYANVELLREKRRGSYAARNRAIAHARGDILAFTDSDCIPAREWLEAGVSRVLADDHDTCVGGRILVFADRPDAMGIAEIYQMLNAFPQQLYVERYSFSTTANMFVRARTIATVGSFDDSLISSGDREWGQRAARAGVKMRYADDVVIQHPARSSFSALRTKTRRVQVGELRLREIDERPLVRGEITRLALRPPVRSLARDARRFPTRDPLQYGKYVMFVLGLYYYKFYMRLRLAVRVRVERTGGTPHERATNALP